MAMGKAGELAGTTACPISSTRSDQPLHFTSVMRCMQPSLSSVPIRLLELELLRRACGFAFRCGLTQTDRVRHTLVAS